MTLSVVASHFAAEIAGHDWSDAPYRLDRAGHQRADDPKSRATDPVLAPAEADRVATNVMWTAAQVLGYLDPAFDVHEFAEACGISPSIRLTQFGQRSGAIDAGIRKISDGDGARYDYPGNMADRPSVRAVTNSFGRDAAICGEVRVEEGIHAFAHNVKLLAPRTHVVTTYEGMAYGEGYVKRLHVRGTWHVVEWEVFRTFASPYPCTAKNGRKYVEVLL